MTIAALANVWAFVFPQPYTLAILSLVGLPWMALAVVRRSRGLIRIDTSRNDAHPNVAFAFILPAATLLLRSTDFNIIHSMMIIWAALAIGSLLTVAAVAADSSLRVKVRSILAIGVLSLIYGLGVTVQANVLLD
jgi:hypothetical protein